MGRHRAKLNPLLWPRRVLLTIAITITAFLGMSAALAPGMYDWLRSDMVVAVPSFGWGEVVADKPDTGTPPDLTRPSA